MKKVTTKEFFTVMWSGLCQALGWFFGLFGYKRDGKFAKCVWGLFATSAAIVMGIIAFVFVYGLGDETYRWYKRQYCVCDNRYCYENTYISGDIYFHNHGDGKGYVYNIRTGEKLLKHVEWIAVPSGKDSLVCFSDGKKRGYFSKKTGKVMIEPKYVHAWVFSEGLASVEEGGYIKFIDTTGKVVIDNKLEYEPDQSGYFFHGGYCVVPAKDGEHYGLMDRKGQIVLSTVFGEIELDGVYNLWRVQKGNEMAVLDRDLKYILPLMECSLNISEGTINVTMPDHTLRKYTLQGELMNDFYIVSTRMLEYEKDEIKYEAAEFGDNDDSRVEMAPYHPKATARLRAYVAGEGYEGLMTADGHIVIMPIYQDINALGYDLYLCTSTDYDKVIVNGKGEIVR